ncbi:MAG: hypothetical protein HC804_04365 [Anaerolineae bacterium]|nr:hypothetical protein [Anaerolineae bacterium]
MKNKQNWAIAKTGESSPVDALPAPVLATNQPAVNEFCHILARILRRIASPSEQ